MCGFFIWILNIFLLVLFIIFGVKSLSFTDVPYLYAYHCLCTFMTILFLRCINSNNNLHIPLTIKSVRYPSVYLLWALDHLNTLFEMQHSQNIYWLTFCTILSSKSSNKKKVSLKTHKELIKIHNSYRIGIEACIFSFTFGALT